MNAVIDWLDSAEGSRWQRGHARLPVTGRRGAGPAFAHILPDPGDDGTPPVHLGPVNPAFDPCGRPPLPASAP